MALESTTHGTIKKKKDIYQTIEPLYIYYVKSNFVATILLSFIKQCFKQYTYILYLWFSALLFQGSFDIQGVSCSDLSSSYLFFVLHFKRG